MDPIDIAWQLLKEVGIEGPADPHRPGMSPGMSGTTGRMQDPQDDLPPEAYEQLNQALEEEARLRNMPTDQSEMPPPPGPKDNMRIMPPRSDDFSGLPSHMQDYTRQLSALRGRPPQGTSVQDPNQVLRSMSPIDLAMDALQKRTPRSFRGEPGYEQFAPHAMTAGADTPEDISQEEYQNMMDEMASLEDSGPHEPLSDGDTPWWEGLDRKLPSEIPVEDPARHHQLDVGRQEAMREGVDIQQTRTPPADVRFRSPEEGRRDPNETPSNPFPRGPSL